MAGKDEDILSEIDWERMNRIAKFQGMNRKVIELYADYLNNHPTFITKELVDSITDECNVTREYAFYVLLAALCGLDAEQSQRDGEMAKEYLLPSIKCLDVMQYKENEYYKNIRIPEIKFHNWELRYESYQPYEGFIWLDIEVKKDYKEVPMLGFFMEEFPFPAVLESNVEWMTITPNEIETMQPVIDRMRGEIVTFGLGLGYFTYMTSIKEDVNKITVVERDEKVIDLFTAYILPQFQYREKVEIIHMDAFEFAKKHLSEENYTYAFVDLWHDASDGFMLYLQMKNYEKLSTKTEFYYWIEPSFLSQLRSYSFLAMLRLKKKTCLPGLHTLQDDTEPVEFEQRIECVMQGILEEEAKSPRSLDYYLGDEFLHVMARKIADNL